VDNYLRIVYKSKNLSLIRKAKKIEDLFINEDSKTKLKEVYFEIINYGGYFTALINNKFFESYLNIRYKGLFNDFYRENIFQFELYHYLLYKTNLKLKKEDLINIFSNFQIDNALQTPLLIYDKKEELELTIKNLSNSFKSQFHILRDFMPFFNIEKRNLNLLNLFKELKKCNLNNLTINFLSNNINGFSNKKIKKTNCRIIKFLQAIKNLLENDQEYNKDEEIKKVSKEYFCIEKSIRKDLIQKSNLNNDNLIVYLCHKDNDINKKIDEDDYDNYDDNIQDENDEDNSISFCTEKINLSLLKSLKAETDNIHNLFNYKSKSNILSNPNFNTNCERNSPNLSFFQKNSSRFVTSEDHGLRSIKINCGPGDIFFIGIDSENTKQLISICEEKFVFNILEDEYQAFPDFDFLIKNKIKFYPFILKAGDILNMSPGVFYL